MNETVVDRILFLENEIKEKYRYDVPGTIIQRSRINIESKTFGWSIGYGCLIGVKKYFYGRTIEEALHYAEESFRKNEL